jgi:hypothetical protein
VARLPLESANQKCRWDAAANAAHGAIAVHRSGAWVHHAKVAFAVHDFAG